MSRLRIHFSKSGFACFISHLDLPMLFGRAARRAGLRAEMTQGFSPHPRLALCPPLPVGVIALSEPADFWFEAWDGDSLSRWGEALPPGIEILDAREVDGLSLNKLCSAASWSIESLFGVEPAAIAEVLASALGEMGALLRAEARGGTAFVAAGDLERCGPSFMVKRL
ncbi:MAG: TIGR03936 family radical SAM-associated protein, partial [Synergistaceae bacterium]|nr:TIGR03936 family radical SAM-associated protein [Synergistaceae bacterium]